MPAIEAPLRASVTARITRTVDIATWQATSTLRSASRRECAGAVIAQRVHQRQPRRLHRRRKRKHQRGNRAHRSAEQEHAIIDVDRRQANSAATDGGSVPQNAAMPPRSIQPASITPATPASTRSAVLR